MMIGEFRSRLENIGMVPRGIGMVPGETGMVPEVSKWFRDHRNEFR